jgi:hypothetical protein
MPRRVCKRLLRERFRLPFRGGSEANRRQKGTDQHYQQIDFHVTLRCAIAAMTATMQKAFQPAKGVPARLARSLRNDSGAIKNG